MPEINSSMPLLKNTQKNKSYCSADKQLIFGSFLLITSGLSLGIGLYRSTAGDEQLGSLKAIPPAGADTLIGTGVTCFWSGLYFLYQGTKKTCWQSTQKKLNAISMQSPFFSAQHLPLSIDTSISQPEDLMTGAGEFDSLNTTPINNQNGLNQSAEV